MNSLSAIQTTHVNKHMHDTARLIKVWSFLSELFVTMDSVRVSEHATSVHVIVSVRNPFDDQDMFDKELRERRQHKVLKLYTTVGIFFNIAKALRTPLSGQSNAHSSLSPIMPHFPVSLG